MWSLKSPALIRHVTSDETLLEALLACGKLKHESCRGPLSLAKAVPVMKRCVVTAQKPSLPNPAIRHSREIIPLVTNTLCQKPCTESSKRL